MWKENRHHYDPYNNIMSKTKSENNGTHRRLKQLAQVSWSLSRFTQDFLCVFELIPFVDIPLAVFFCFVHNNILFLCFFLSIAVFPIYKQNTIEVENRENIFLLFAAKDI